MMQTSRVDRVIGSRLRSARIACEIDKAQLAQRIGTTEAQIDAYESGVIRIDPNSMLMLCRKLAVNVDFFFEPWTKSSQEPEASTQQIAAE